MGDYLRKQYNELYMINYNKPKRKIKKRLFNYLIGLFILFILFMIGVYFL